MSLHWTPFHRVSANNVYLHETSPYPGHQLSLDKAFFEQVSLEQVSLEQVFHGQVSPEQVCLELVSAEQVSPEKVSFDKASID